MRERLTKLYAPAALETFVPAIPAHMGDPKRVRRAALGITLVTTLKLERAGKLILSQDNAVDPVLAGRPASYGTRRTPTSPTPSPPPACRPTRRP